MTAVGRSRPSGPADNAGGRVLVLLDGSRVSLEALRAGVAIAAGQGHELLAVFGEETNLLRCAGYGFAREVGASSGLAHPLDVEVLERRLQRQARQAREAMHAALAGSSLHHEFRVCRGDVPGQVLGLMGPEDLLVLGRPGVAAWPMGGHIDATTRSLLGQVSGSILLWSEARPSRSARILVMVERIEQAEKLLSVAHNLALRNHRELMLAIPGEQLPPLQASTLLAAFIDVSPKLELVPLASLSPEAALDVVRRHRPAQLVCSQDSSLLQGRSGALFVSEIKIPLTIVHC